MYLFVWTFSVLQCPLQEFKWKIQTHHTKQVTTTMLKILFFFLEKKKNKSVISTGGEEVFVVYLLVWWSPRQLLVWQAPWTSGPDTAYQYSQYESHPHPSLERWHYIQLAHLCVLMKGGDMTDTVHTVMITTSYNKTMYVLLEIIEKGDKKKQNCVTLMWVRQTHVQL